MVNQLKKCWLTSLLLLNFYFFLKFYFKFLLNWLTYKLVFIIVVDQFYSYHIILLKFIYHFLLVWLKF